MAAPLIEYLKVQYQADRAILLMLRQTARSVDSEISKIEKLGDLSVSQKIKRAQLANSKQAIHEAIDQHMAMVGGEIRGRRSQVAEVAGKAIADTAEIFETAGYSPGQVKAMQQSMIKSAQVGVESAMARMQGLSYVPLSRKVYKAAALSKGQVDRVIQDHLARGSSARELASDVRRFVNPRVRGGLRYASMRLSRTELNNAFHAVTVDQSKKSPHVIAMQWIMSGSHPRPDRCNDFDQVEYLPHEVPDKPHPNCLCVVIPITPTRDQFLDNYRAGKYDGFVEEHLPVPELAGNHAPLARGATDSKGVPFGRNVVAAANDVHATAVKQAVGITADIQSLVPKGAELTGLPYRVKTPESLAVKIRSDSIANKITPKTAASEVFDSVRFTQTSSPGRMAADANHTLDGLRSRGYEVTKVKNTWGNDQGNPYYGVNVKVLHPSGQQIEMQFHTPESFDVKEVKLHGLYDQQKLTTPHSPEWTSLNDQMHALSGGMTVPKDVHSIR